MRIEALPNTNTYIFEELYLKKNKPLLITQGIKEWPALQWNATDLIKSFPNQEVNFNFINLHTEKIPSDNFIKLKDLLHLFILDKPINNFLGHAAFKSFPDIQKDFEIPSWANKLNSYDVDILLDSKNSLVPLHWQSNHCFMAQILGHKTVYLYPPHQSHLLAPSYDLIPHNHSLISNVEKVDAIKFPDFKKSTPYRLKLNPGQVLFIPSGWWYQIKSHDACLSVNFMWRPKLNECHPHHILRQRLCAEFKKNQFDQIETWLDLKNANNELEVAQYLYDENCIWAAVIFCAIYAKKFLDDFSFENYLQNLVYLAFEETNSLFEEFDISNLIMQLQNEPTKIKNSF